MRASRKNFVELYRLTNWIFQPKTEKRRVEGGKKIMPDQSQVRKKKKKNLPVETDV